MFSAVPLLCALLLPQAPQVEVKFEQVLPAPPDGKLLGRSRDQTRAVVLMQGLTIHPFSKENVSKPILRDWQQPSSVLAKELVKVGDVFAYAYSQDTNLKEIIEKSQLEAFVAQLRKMGYQEVVLVGHSAGGLIARHFVEDHPDVGVTKVIQVCSPNLGSTWAKVQLVRKNQRPFLDSLTREARLEILGERKDKRIPGTVQFVCIVGNGAGEGDGVVGLPSQWSEDLQKQGIPAIPLSATHWQAMRSPKGAETIRSVIQTRQQRWDSERVRKTRKTILGE